MKTLLHPAYIPNIRTISILAQQEVMWEVEDNFQKQTYRNRAYICADRGKLMLNIPIQHVGKDQGRQKYKDIRIDHSENWQRQHWRTLQTAYRTSPFFEYYEDEIAPLYEEVPEFLLDFNLKSIAIICDCLQITMPKEKSSSYETQPSNTLDLRSLVDAKKKYQQPLEPYTQVFGDRHGFLENMSILDLLFNEGTNALSYLKKVEVKTQK